MIVDNSMNKFSLIAEGNFNVEKIIYNNNVWRVINQYG